MDNRTIVDVNYEDLTVTFYTNHFSGIKIQVFGSIYTAPDQWFSNFDVTEDCFNQDFIILAYVLEWQTTPSGINLMSTRR